MPLRFLEGNSNRCHFLASCLDHVSKIAPKWQEMTSHKPACRVFGCRRVAVLAAKNTSECMSVSSPQPQSMKGMLSRHPSVIEKFTPRKIFLETCSYDGYSPASIVDHIPCFRIKNKGRDKNSIMFATACPFRFIDIATVVADRMRTAERKFSCLASGASILA